MACAAMELFAHMFGIHRFWTISQRLIAVAAIMFANLLAVVAIWATTFEHYKINGPVYASIVSLQDLVGDILPPPEYIIESELTAVQADAASKSTLPGLREVWKASQGLRGPTHLLEHGWPSGRDRRSAARQILQTG